MDFYDVAQICLNGHLINVLAKGIPASNQKHCSICGASTIIACQSCDTSIKGYINISNSYLNGFLNLKDIDYKYIIPNFCHECGKPYPWLELKLEAAKELADLIDDLKPEDKELLKKSLDDLVTDTPRTSLAAMRFKKIMAKVAPHMVDAMKQITVDIIVKNAEIWR